MTRRTHLIWPILVALAAAGCARQQPAYYVDSATGQPVAMVPQQKPSQQAQARERGLFNNFSRSAPQPYRAPVYARQQPAQQSYPQQAYAPQPQVYAQQQAYRPPAQYYQPYYGTGGPYAPAPQPNPYAQARWY